VVTGGLPAKGQDHSLVYTDSTTALSTSEAHALKPCPQLQAVRSQRAACPYLRAPESQPALCSSACRPVRRAVTARSPFPTPRVSTAGCSQGTSLRNPSSQTRCLATRPAVPNRSVAFHSPRWLQGSVVVYSPRQL